MDQNTSVGFSRRAVLFSAFRYSVPVLLGYVSIGIAFGLMLTGTGYPWYLALAMSLWMYAGAGQFIAVGLFAAGTTLWQACLVQFIVNARHIAYGFSMLERFRNQGSYKPYQVFSLTDETFALLSSIPEKGEGGPVEFPLEGNGRKLFMFYVAIMDQCYWVAGTVAGAVAGTLIPFDMKGIGFALTALFIVLMIEQMQKAKKPLLFIISGISALLGVFLLPSGVSLLAALALALLSASFAARNGNLRNKEGE